MNNLLHSVSLSNLIIILLVSCILLYPMLKILIKQVSRIVLQNKINSVIKKYPNLQELHFEATDAFVKIWSLNHTKLNFYYINGWTPEMFPQLEVLAEYKKNDKYKALLFECNIKETDLFKELDLFAIDMKQIIESPWFYHINVEYTKGNVILKVELCP